MTAVTVDGRVEGAVAHEYALLDIGEAYTYISKLSNPQGCIMTNREDIDAVLTYTLSGRTFTFHESGGSGVKVFIDIVGRL